MIYNYYNKLFWGFVLILIDINIGYFDILPDLIGYILIVHGLELLKKVNRDGEFSKAMVCAGILIVSTLIGIFFPIDLLEKITITNMTITIGFEIIQLCMIYFILEGSVETLKLGEKAEIADDISRNQEKYVYLQLLLIFLTCFLINTNDDLYYFLTIGIVAGSIILNIWIVILINRIKKCFLNETS